MHVRQSQLIAVFCKEQEQNLCDIKGIGKYLESWERTLFKLLMPL